ncbi:hypothetical protein [Paenalcaligenes sp.]|uniref:hypothetical protein n=1 Tax=Paenalcaligenes sp. TaxID=1966342 RepID=UPI002615E153|nr:hypothetical protein [Paenalcaligenes sp.]
MNDLDKILRNIKRVTAPVREINERLNRVLPPYIQKINEILDPVSRALSASQPFFEQVATTMAKVAEAAQRWQKARKTDVAVMAESGWYPNWFTFFYTPEAEPQSVDELMIMHLNSNWEEITQKIIELCPNRAHILETAFSLHKSGNYIAAIPLFLAQADGICCESFKSFLFTGNDTEEKIKELIESGEIEANMFTDIFLEPFKLKNHHNASISKSSVQAKSKAPNRNGILHGHRKHLDYGTEINSLKCFSLLSFIVYFTKEIIVKT